MYLVLKGRTTPTPPLPEADRRINPPTRRTAARVPAIIAFRLVLTVCVELQGFAVRVCVHRDVMEHLFRGT